MLHRLRAPRLAALLLVLPCAAAARPLMVVSVDGLSWENWQRHRAHLPNLSRLAETGSFGPLRSVFPSMTWPAHASLVTGVLPARHGVVGNEFRGENGEKTAAWDIPNLLRAPAIWDAAAAQGRTIAAVFWSGSGGVQAIRWNLPETYAPETFVRDTSPAMGEELAALGWKPADLKPVAAEETYLEDMLSRDLGLRLIRTHRPDLMLMHLLSTDTWSHKLGPESPAVGMALDLADRIVGDWLAAWRATPQGAQLDTMIVSDHGFASTRNPLALEPLLAAAPLPSRVRRALLAIPNGHCTYLYGVPPGHAQRFAAWLATRPGVERVVLPAEYEALGIATADDARRPSMILVSPVDTLPVPGAKTTLGARGGHGYFPDHPALLGIAIQAGPSSDLRGTQPVAPITSLAARMAKAIGVAWRP